MTVQSEETHITEEHVFEMRDGVRVLRNSRLSSYKITTMLGGPGRNAKSHQTDPRILHGAEVISRHPLNSSPNQIDTTTTQESASNQSMQLQLKPSKAWVKEFLASLGFRKPDLVLTDLNIRKQAYAEPKLLRLSRGGSAIDYGDRVAYYPESQFLKRPVTHNHFHFFAGVTVILKSIYLRNNVKCNLLWEYFILCRQTI